MELFLLGKLALGGESLVHDEGAENGFEGEEAIEGVAWLDLSPGSIYAPRRP